MKYAFFILSLMMGFSAHAAEENQAHLMVVETEPGLEQNIVEVFKRNGTDAVAKSILDDLESPAKMAAWQKIANGTEARALEVKIHPNEREAVKWMNSRFERMGLKNLSLEGVVDDSLPDPTSLPDQEIRGRKWLRYLAGPGVALAATLINLPSGGAISGTDYMLLVVPSVGVGVTTVLLELQFASPYLNNKFWKHVWNFGGRAMGRVSNVIVNFLYGMALYGSGVGASHLPVLFGGDVIPFAHIPFVQAVTTAAIGGFTFHLAMGQFQTDISEEEKRGAISGPVRYGLEATGVVINNSARVLDWVLPLGLGSWAQAAFFSLKTLPQALKTNFQYWLQDRKVHRRLSPETAPQITVVESCAHLLGSTQLVNLPTLKK